MKGVFCSSGPRSLRNKKVGRNILFILFSVAALASLIEFNRNTLERETIAQQQFQHMLNRLQENLQMESGTSGLYPDIFISVESSLEAFQGDWSLSASHHSSDLTLYKRSVHLLELAKIAKIFNAPEELKKEERNVKVLVQIGKKKFLRFLSSKAIRKDLSIQKFIILSKIYATPE